MAHVKAKVDLLEVAVERDRNPFYPSPEKQKANEAHIGLAIPEVDLGAGRDVGVQDGRIDFVIQHHKPAPLGSEEGGRIRHVRFAS